MVHPFLEVFYLVSHLPFFLKRVLLNLLTQLICNQLLKIINKKYKTPDIYLNCIISIRQYKFWCTIVPTYNIRSIFSLLIKNFRTAKITNFYLVLFWIKDIFWFKISMTNVFRMYILKTKKYLINNFFNLNNRDLFVISYILLNKVF